MSDHASIKSSASVHRHYDRAQGMCDAALNTDYQSIIVARIMHAACARWGFAIAADRCRIDGFFFAVESVAECRRDMVKS